MHSGQRVGKYVLDQPIARGGMAEVWSGHVEGPQGFVKPLALKFILDAFTGDSELERLFVNEARVAAQMQHANLVTVFDFGTVEEENRAGPMGRYYIAMERVDGRDLRRVLQGLAQRRRRLPVSIALYIAGEVLKGLRYVHERRDPITRRPLQLIHRDVSPHNVLIGRGGEVKLSDFGIAKAMSQSLGTRSGMMRGKLAYAPPEQVRAEEVDHRGDQFALGVTLWEMLAERRLFDAADERDIVGRVLRGTVPRLPRHLEVARDVEDVVRRMLARSREDRFASTAAALSAVLATRDYSSDGAPLADLLQEVFPDDVTEPAATAPLMSAKPARPLATPELRTCTLLADEVEIVGTASVPVPEGDHARPADVTTGGAYVGEIEAEKKSALVAQRRPALRAGQVAVGVAAAAGLLAWRLTYSGTSFPRRERRSPAASSPSAGASEARSSAAGGAPEARLTETTDETMAGSRPATPVPQVQPRAASPEQEARHADLQAVADESGSERGREAHIVVHATSSPPMAGPYDEAAAASFRYPPTRSRLTLAGPRAGWSVDEIAARSRFGVGQRRTPPSATSEAPASSEPDPAVPKRANGAPILE